MNKWLETAIERETELAVGRSLNDPRDFSYRDLWSQVEGIRKLLVAKNILKPQRVGVLAQRSFQSYATVLACLLEGIAFVPLNPKWPRERFKAIAYDLKMNLILFEKRLGWVELPLETENLEIPLAQSFVEVSSPKAVSESELAYVIATSGTTGAPKLVGVSRANLSTLLDSLQAATPLSSKDRLTQIYDLSFDLGVGEVVWALLLGASLHPFESSEATFVETYLKSAQPTVWSSTPSLLNWVLQAARGSAACVSIRLSLFCGEVLPCDLVKRWRELNPQSRNFNFYGPTEATVYASFFEIREYDQSNDLPIGMALPGVLTQIDAVTGELMLGGAQIVSGYLNSAEESEKKFSRVDEIQWYRTGDKVELLKDGNLSFRGRLDRQIKFDGYRVELDEVEILANRILKSPCAVEYQDGKLILFAHIEAQRWSPEELKKSLAKLLPTYSLPQEFIALTTWPLNGSGKLNRKDLKKK